MMLGQFPSAGRAKSLGREIGFSKTLNFAGL